MNSIIEKNLEIGKDTLTVSELDKQIKDYHRCLGNDRCTEASDSDPRAQIFGARKILLEALMRWPKGPLTEQERGTLNRRLKDLLEINDGAIKARALEILASQNPHDENVDLVLDHVMRYHDSNLLGLGLSELQRHLAGPQASKIHEVFGEILTNGSLLVRQALADKIGPFINQGSYRYYDSLSKSPRLDESIRRSLRSSVREWELRQSRG